MAELGIPGFMPALPNQRDTAVEQHTTQFVAEEEEHPVELVDGRYEVIDHVEEDDLTRFVRLQQQKLRRTESGGA